MDVLTPWTGGLTPAWSQAPRVRARPGAGTVGPAVPAGCIVLRRHVPTVRLLERIRSCDMTLFSTVNSHNRTFARTLAAGGTENLEPWQLTFQARTIVHEHYQDGLRKAGGLIQQALRPNNHYALAWGMGYTSRKDGLAIRAELKIRRKATTSDNFYEIHY